MKKVYAYAVVPLALTGCAPSSETTSSEAPTDKAIDACLRTDVQDVVGKEVRNLMLKANLERIMVAAAFGQDTIATLEKAAVSFEHVGAITGQLPLQPPYRQIVCGGSMQINASSARSGQDIVTIPHLRWSINFTQPTQEPATEGFTVDVDEKSISDGLLVNGKTPAQASDEQSAAAPDSDTSPPARRIYLSPDDQAEAAAAAADASASAAQAAADAKAAAEM
jgi:hypothetical protein